MTERDLWDDEMKNQIISRNGSVQGIDEIPDDIKALYKTVWEVSQKTVLKMAADRGAFIDQSQSLNVHVAEPNYGKLTSVLWLQSSHQTAGRFSLQSGTIFDNSKKNIYKMLFHYHFFYFVDQKNIVFRVGFDELQQDSEYRVLK